MEIDKIKKFVSSTSYFEYENFDGGISFATRENGSVSNEIASTFDINEGRKLKKGLLAEFNDIVVKLEIVDEWVILFVSKLIEIEPTYSYSFIKRCDKGSGFGESFDDIDLLIKKYRSWLDIDWDKVKTDLINLDKFPNEVYGGFESFRYVLSLSTNKENRWGYNFYIIKTKKK